MQPITLYTKTDIGKERITNEDSVASLIMNSQSFRNEFNYGILVVADGMGGLQKGELASELATKKFIETVTENIFQVTSQNGKIKFQDVLTKAVESANKEVWALAESQEGKIGTTLVGAIIVNNHVYVVNVGDSRAYLIHQDKSIQQITKDHSAVQAMLDNHIITKEQAKNHPRRNILTKALGLSESVSPDFYEQDMKNETLMLCSDGLYGMIEDHEITQTINGSIYKSADDLISLANRNGGIDNISVAIARYSA
ncbi:MAG: Stp1/IreP family PP2C-type Ser/Thr phosphatase [Flavobacterium sp.]|nr:Stp1/IreP family PP2C-type Ser/Thr phosphatase [Flavobacterium sp.]